jgi:L-alanine-DL-glutamate epimerase-like enolase superfamily enzyme
LREFLPYFREQAMDVAIIDAVWNGVWQAMKIAAAADAFEVNIAPHNFYGHLATMMNAHFAASAPNLRIMEVDIDRLPWDEQCSPQCRSSRTAIWSSPIRRAGEPSP